MPPCMAQTAPPGSSLNFPRLSSIDIGGAAGGVQEVKMAQLVLDPKTQAGPPLKDGRKEERKDAKERR